jgi:hypothetical protein
MAFFELLWEQYHNINNELQWLKIHVMFDELSLLNRQINCEMKAELLRFLQDVVPVADQTDFSKLVEVFYHKGYGDWKSANYFFDSIVPKLSHSCLPNCSFDFCENVCHIRCIRDINANQQLTVNYAEHLIFKPASERRELLLLNEGFFCSCERCDAFCDDTRQFNCFNDENCNGKHHIHQPTGNSTIKLTKCTLCRKSAPIWSIDYAKQWELEFVQFKSDLVNKFREASAIFQVTKDASVMTTVMSVPCHNNHFLSSSLSLELIAFSVDYFTLMGLTKRFLQPYFNAALFPNRETINALFCASKCFYCVYQRIKVLNVNNISDEQKEISLEALWLAKHVFQIALRDTKLLHGRDVIYSPPQTDSYETFTKILDCFTSVPISINNCQFCEDSSYLTTNLILKRCSRCRKVSYCGKACQQGHWKLHKKNCNVVKYNIDV